MLCKATAQKTPNHFPTESVRLIPGASVRIRHTENPSLPLTVFSVFSYRRVFEFYFTIYRHVCISALRYKSAQAQRSRREHEEHLYSNHNHNRKNQHFMALSQTLLLLPHGIATLSLLVSVLLWRSLPTVLNHLSSTTKMQLPLLQTHIRSQRHQATNRPTDRPAARCRVSHFAHFRALGELSVRAVMFTVEHVI